MADAIKDALDVEVELIGGGRGIFDLSVDGQVVASKNLSGFPTPEQCVEAVRTARHVLSQPAFDRYNGGEVSPGPDVQTDDEILAWVAKEAETALHPSCTAKMGTDDLAVVERIVRAIVRRVLSVSRRHTAGHQCDQCQDGENQVPRGSSACAHGPSSVTGFVMSLRSV